MIHSRAIWPRSRDSFARRPVSKRYAAATTTGSRRSCASWQGTGGDSELGSQGIAQDDVRDLPRDEVLARRDGVRADLETFIAASEADLAPLLHEALQDAIADYELLKAKSGASISGPPHQGA